MSKETGIVLCAQDVKRVLNGEKITFRTVLSKQPASSTVRMYCETAGEFDAKVDKWYAECLNSGQRWIDNVAYTCPFGVIGDRLWVKETFCYIARSSEGPMPISSISYRADRDINVKSAFDGQWRSPATMPRWASRINLKIVGINVAKRFDLTEQAATAEGFKATNSEFGGCKNPLRAHECPFGCNCFSARENYAHALVIKHGVDTLDYNPWTWVLEFKLLTP